MIAYLEGKLFQVERDSLILLTHGVGYQVYVSRPTLESLPPIGTEISLFIHTLIREDAQLLFGFSNSQEKTLFLYLIQVNSVGPKLALALLSGLTVPELASAIHREDILALTAIPGIGKRTAERLIVDLKDKLLGLIITEAESPPLHNAIHATKTEEAISALVNLGYSRQEAQRALQTLPSEENWTLELLVKAGLKALS